MSERGGELLAKLIREAVADPMVPKGYMEIHDGDGKLLRRQWIGFLAPGHVDGEGRGQRQEQDLGGHRFDA